MVSLSLNRLRSGNIGCGGTAKTTGSQSPIRNVSPGRVVGEAKATPTLILRVLVLKARNLAAKDRNGTSDPYLVATLGDAKSVTHAVYKTLNPEWNVCFDLPMIGTQSLLLECVCWDKDRFGKDYLGEFDVALEEVFANGKPTQEPSWYKLRSSRKAANISGEVELQFSLIDPVDPAASPDQILAKFYAMAAVSPDADDDEEADALGRSGNADIGVEDDADEDDETVEPTSDETDDTSKPESAEKKKLRLARLKRKKKAIAYEFMHGSDVVGIVFLEISRITDLPPERNVTRTSFDMDPFVVASLGRKTYRTRVIRHNLNPVFDERMIFNVTRHEQTYSLSFAVVDRDKLSGNDFVGTASLELPDLISAAPEADPETGLYRLPEIPDATAQTPPLNRPRFKFPTSRSSSSASLNRLSGRPGLKARKSSSSLLVNGMPVSSTPAPASAEQGSSSASTASGPPPEAVTGSATLPLPVLNAPDASTAECSEPETDPELRPYDLPLALKNKERWESKHNPVLHVRAKYMPYPALRQYFWRAMLKQYDADDSGRISKVELTTMLDTLGSTLKESTVDGFFQRFADQSSLSDPNTAELTFDQAVICLEDQLEKASAKRSIWNSVEQGLEKAVGTHVHHHHHHLHLHHRHKQGDASGSDDRSSATDNGALPTSAFAANTLDESRNGPASEGDKTTTPPFDDLEEDQYPGEEHVVEIRECPICHQPRLHKKSDADIITHIATCASQDWRQVNSLVMAEFVTSSQAQRKWYSKVITKLSYGGYKLGANSANILVQDRITGQINEERMSVYVRLGIRLLYKGLKSREMEKKRIRKLLRSLSIKQGRKFDDPASAREIPAFINFHRLNLDEVLLPLEEFKTFNEFFYRRLKPDARPCSAPDNPSIVVSPADCRCVVFNRIEEATAIWIKGREFSVARLLGSAYPADAKRYANGALGVFRLAPQDYHRFHIPVDGVLDTPKTIAGEYYTVNPMAVRSALDVYGENVRVVVPIDSIAHGRVMVVCVGAMMVGSTVITATAGQRVQRADELGYFKFGGSTIVLLFEPGMVKFDEDLVGNSKGALETLVRAGMSIGHSPDQPPYTPDRRKSHPTREEQLDAQIRIGGAQQETSPLPARPLPGASSL